MVAETRTTAATLEKALLANSDRFSYFQAIRLLRLLGKGGSASLEKLRIRPKLGLGFPESDIDQIEVLPQGGYQITANFFGLYGVASPLPAYYTEDLFEEEREGRHATRDFLDVIHFAMYPLLFDAWNKYRLHQRIVEAEDNNVLNHLYAFVGLDNSNLRVDLLPSSAGLLRYAGIFNQRPRSALGLHTILADAFSPAQVEIDSCVPQRLTIPSDQQLSLGIQGHCLGEETYLGTLIDDYANHIRIRLCEVPAKLFHELLPGQAGNKRLHFLTRYYLLDPLAATVQINLADNEAQPTRLNSRYWSQLGLDTWLTPEHNDAPAQVSFSL